MKLKKTIATIALMSIVLTGAGYAESKLEEITVNKNVVQSIVIDGVDRTPEENKAFLYDGEVYISAKYISDQLGKAATWSGQTGTLTVGNQAGEIVYFTDITPYNTSEYFSTIYHEDRYKIDSDMTMGNTKYNKGLQLQTSGYKMKKIYYNFNGIYSIISGLVGMDDSSNSMPFDSPMIVNFYADDQLIHTVKLKGGDLPKDFTLDITGCAKFTIEAGCEKNNNPLINIVNAKIK